MIKPFCMENNSVSYLQQFDHGNQAYVLCNMCFLVLTRELWGALLSIPWLNLSCDTHYISVKEAFEP